MLSSVLIPSFKRPDKLTLCLKSLGEQSVLPSEVIVIWQADDEQTAIAAEAARSILDCDLKILHSPEAGVVCAENLGLSSSSGEIILLCDDDVILPNTWIAKHLAFYEDSEVGAVGGSANNHRPDGSLFPKREVEPIGKLTWFGKCYGNMYDQVDEWVNLPPREVNHLVGYNFSLRRSAFKNFEPSLKPYWQLFELDACLQVKAKGYRVMFDFSNVVNHFPTNTAYVGGRNGDLQVKIFNGSYNNALILAKHSSSNVLLIRLLYIMLIGSDSAPGFLASLRAVLNYRNPRQELEVLRKAIASKLEGWRDGLGLREIS